MMDEKVSRSIRFRRWLKDAAERVIWTGAQVVVASVSVEALGLPEWAIVPATIGLAALKSLVARKVGDDDSAGTVTL
jgi:hypothetical protein